MAQALVKITMTATQQGSPDHISVKRYVKGETVEVPADLAEAFVKHIKCAVYGDKAPEPAAEAAAAAPQKKMDVAVAPENKAVAVEAETKDAAAAEEASPIAKAAARTRGQRG